MQAQLRARLEGEIDSLKQKGAFRRLRVVDGAEKAVCVIDGKEVINLSSNNYLGLTTHPKLMAAARHAIDTHGVGTAAVRTIIGTMDIHQELEERLAKFKHTEATLTFQSGFASNQGIIQALLEEGDAIISDELNHASIIDGIRLSKAGRFIFRHADMNDLEAKLKEAQNLRTKIIITDGVFSMDGDIAKLPEIVALGEKYGAAVYVDDAHASGVLGRNGRGTTDHFDLNGRVDIQIGTFSKAFGSQGGYVAGIQPLRDFLIHKARTMLFSNALPPSVIASCIAAIDVLETETELIDRMWENTRYFKGALKKLGFDIGESITPITPIIAGSGAAAFKLSDRLFQEGVFAQGIGYPTVPEARSRVRTIMTAAHTKDNMDAAIAAFEKVGRELGLI
ncbi:MAG TPA: glycine C-acetyltransferase [Chloroflexia bacterium]|nr:glycine C-acetyltransferase [Chloroflexia bacterium]